MKEVVITDRAWDDLLAILRHVASDNVTAADRLFDELYDKCRTLVDNPLAFPLVEGYEHAEIRRRVHGAYLIFYRCRGDLIEVLHVLHGARDRDTIL